MEKPIILSLFDISKFFDRESLVGTMSALHNYNINGKLYRHVYILNKDTIIQVKTGVGLSEKEETGENVGQGTIDGALVSSAGISNGVDDVFSKSKHEIVYGGDKLQPFIFQDDIIRACLSTESLRAGNRMMEEIIEGKLLDFNLSKSCCMVIGKNKLRQNLIKEIGESEIKLCGQPVQIVESEKWLGDYLHSKGNSQSIIATIKSRNGLALSSCMDIINIIEDIRASVIGGLMTGIQMFELCVVPYVLNNSDTWDYIPKEAMDMLEKLENTFYCHLLGTPRKGSPQPSVFWEIGQVPLKYKIMEKTLIFYHHVMS